MQIYPKEDSLISQSSLCKLPFFKENWVFILKNYIILTLEEALASNLALLHF